jgi:hypothetical protein
MRRDLVDLANRYPETGWSQAIARLDGPAEDAPEAESADVESDENAA